RQSAGRAAGSSARSGSCRRSPTNWTSSFAGCWRRTRPRGRPTAWGWRGSWRRSGASSSGRGTARGRAAPPGRRGRSTREGGDRVRGAMMSGVRREELRREKEGGPVNRALNTPWVLLPLLALVLGILVWTFWPASAESLFERGKELMESKALPDKERAFSDYFDPLEKRFPDHPYKEQLEKYRQQLKEARAREEAEPAVSEAQRFYLKGERLRQEGRDAEARKVWQGVVAVFQGADAEKEWVRKAEKGLA